MHKGYVLVPELYTMYCDHIDMDRFKKIKGVTPTREISLISTRFFAKEDIRKYPNGRNN